MGKTRLEELFYELYASSKQHDPWQRHAMIVELRNLLKQPIRGNSGSDHFERSGEDLRFGGDDRRFGGDDRRFGGGQFREGDRQTYGSSAELLDLRFRDYLMLRNDDDDETWTWTETRTIVEPKAEIRESLVHKAIVEDKSTSQFQVPMANSEIVRSIEPGKVDLELEKLEHVVMNENLEQEWDQMNVNEELEVDGDVERGQKIIRDTETSCAHKVLMKMPSKEKRIKHLKGWKFKFKTKSLVGIMLQIEQYKFRERRRKMYNKLSTNIKDESMKVMITGNHLRMLRQIHNSRVQCKMRMMNDSWSMRQPTLKIMKSHRKHKWKSKHLQIASNFWINHSHKLADLVLRTALTDWKTKNSKGLAYDGCVSFEINFAGFGRGKTEMLATSQKMQKMDLFSFGIHTEMGENVELKQLLVEMERYSQEVIEQKIEGGLIGGDVKFHLKHKWRFRLLESFSRLVLLAWINLWFSKAYEFSGQLQDLSKGEAESFPFLNFAAGQHFLWMENKSEPVLTVSALERKKKKLCYKTRMFKYKVPLEGVQLLHYCDKEVPLETNWAVQRNWDKDSPEMMRNKKIKFSKRWWFKYKAPNLDIKVFETSGQCIRKRLFVSADCGTKNNQPTLRSLMNVKQSYPSLRANRVWDPGGSLVDAATP